MLYGPVAIECTLVKKKEFRPFFLVALDLTSEIHDAKVIITQIAKSILDFPLVSDIACPKNSATELLVS